MYNKIGWFFILYKRNNMNNCQHMIVNHLLGFVTEDRKNINHIKNVWKNFKMILKNMEHIMTLLR